MASLAPSSLFVAGRERLKASTLEGAISFLVGCLVVAAILFGWLNRHEGWIDPEDGFGYYLGIAGGSMMLLLLAYPVRKRVRRPAAAVGSIGFWFRFHMLLGLAGPLAILFHSRFTWGALNSAVALGTMLVVAGSGLIGRFFYSRVHRGYSGRKLEVRSLKSDMHELLSGMLAMGLADQVVQERLAPFETRAVAAGASFGSSAAAVVTLGIATRRAQHKLTQKVSEAVKAGHSVDGAAQLIDLSNGYFQAVRRAAEFAFYDRMLRLWHLLHLPLFFLLVASAIMHIIAVHMY